MKKTTLRLVCLLLCLCMALALTACGTKKLSGTYETTGLLKQSLTFDGDKVTISAFGIDASGTYKIEDGKIKFTYSILGLETGWEESFSQSGKSITVGSTVFVKQ